MKGPNFGVRDVEQIHNEYAHISRAKVHEIKSDGAYKSTYEG